MNESPFSRTKCACPSCSACCKRQPGSLAPGDFERIAAHLGETEEQAKAHFWASPGALVKNSETGETVRVGTVTPRFRHGRCVFLDEKDRCKIHEVAPFGCSHFDTHMSAAHGQARSLYLVQQQMQDENYQKLRNALPYATHYKPNRY